MCNRSNHPQTGTKHSIHAHSTLQAAKAMQKQCAKSNSNNQRTQLTSAATAVRAAPSVPAAATLDSGSGSGSGRGRGNGSSAPCCASCFCTLLQNDEPIVIALGQQWHCDCFRCSVCDAHLHNWYFEREGLLYCRDDYCARFVDACQQCMAVITGPVMVAGEHKFHPECFCCAACGAFIGAGETYALVERSKLYCGQCYGKRQAQAGACEMDAKAISTAVAAATAPGGRGQREAMHSIRLVEIPKDATPGLRVDGGALDDGCPTVRITDFICKFYGRVGKYAFSLLTSVAGRCCGSYRIDVNLTNLHIGDRILEVNGTPVSDSSVEQIDKLIRRSTEKMLQLTVEHDPVQVCRSCSQADIQRALSTSTLAALPLTTSASSVEVGSSSSTASGRERLYKAAEQSAKARKMRKTAAAAAAAAASATPLKEKERCSSLSKLQDEQHTAQQHSAHPQLYDLSRTQSCRVVQKPQRIFRASDLVMGEKLGEGFFGKVYKVTDRLSGEVMVLKELHRADEEAQRNFIKEVAVLRLLDHRHVLKFIGVLYKDKKLHMVTEYVAGGCLKELIHDSGETLTWPQRVGFARDIACGMSYLHSMNIIHRDLNSMNCLVREDRSVIVADFGLARSVDTPRPLGASATANGNSTVDAAALAFNSGGSPLSAGGTLRRSKSRQRRQRYTVVGNPYWMAPEMMKGLKYDEKVDVFSFGIMLCEIIGRVEADPDFMPRNSDFSLNQQEFREKFCAHCPEAFIRVAFTCCDLNPDMRPCFDTLHVWLEQLHAHVTIEQQTPPVVLLNEIENYQESYVSSEDALSPTSQRSLDNLDVVCAQEAAATQPPTAEEKENANANQNVIMRPHDIPKSPHLGKDFSPTGERLRDSMRARRRQRFLGAQQQRRGVTPETTSTERALKQVLKKCRPYGEKGFLLDHKPDGELQLHDVRDLNNYSDFDSSCDTSLNYQEANAPITPTPTHTPIVTPTPTPTPPSPTPLSTAATATVVAAASTTDCETDSAIAAAAGVVASSAELQRLSIDDMRTRLHNCRNKFEHLDEANRRNFTQAQHSMRTLFKKPPDALKMFQRLEHEAAQRINQTPIFGRRHLPPPAAPPTSSFLTHAESLENLLCSSGPPKPPRRFFPPTQSAASEPTGQPSAITLELPAPLHGIVSRCGLTAQPAMPSASAAKRSKAAATTVTCTAELHAPALPDNAAAVDCRQPKKHKMALALASSSPTSHATHATRSAAAAPARVSGSSNNSKSLRTQRSSPVRYLPVPPPSASSCGTSPTRTQRALSPPSKHLAQRHTAATAQRLSNVNAYQQQQHQQLHQHQHQHQPSGKTTRLNILSPEKVHRLNAKLSDQKQKLREEANSTASSNGRQICAGSGNHNNNHHHHHHHNNGNSSNNSNSVTVERRKRAPPPPARANFNTRC